MVENTKTSSNPGNRGAWGHRLAELFVVFAGVTGAFVLNEWGTARKDTQRAKEYVHGIISDLSADSVQLTELADACTTRTRAMLRFLFTPAHTKISDDSLRVYLQTMASSETFQPRTVTFDVIKSAGDLSIFTDLTIRKAMIEHYEIYKGVRELDEVAARYWEGLQVPYLMDHVDMVTMTFSDPDIWKTLKFKNVLAAQISFLQQKGNVYHSALVSIDSIQSQLTAYEKGL